MRLSSSFDSLGAIKPWRVRQNRERFPFNQKFRKFWLIHKMVRNISVLPDRNIRDQLWRWSSLTGLVISVGRTEISLSIWQNCCPQYRSFVSLFTRTITKRAVPLSRVCATGMYLSIGHVKVWNRNFCWMESAQKESQIMSAANFFDCLTFAETFR